jgi:hypothetical protein
MIYLYNECDAPQWELKQSKEENRYRMVLKANPKFGIPVNLEKASFNMENLQNRNDNRDFSVIVDAKTAVRFNSRNLHPSIIESQNSFNCDLYFVSFNVEEGFTIINQLRRGAYIYLQYFDAKNQQLHMVLSMSMKEKAYVEDILINETTGKAQMKHVMYSDKYNKASVIKREGDIEKIKKTQRGQRGYMDLTDKRRNGILDLQVYIPMRPTKLIVVENEEDEKTVRDFIRNSYRINDSFSTIIVLEKDANERKKIKSFATEKEYTAIMYYTSQTDHDHLKEHIKEIASDIKNNKFGKYFKFVLLMTNDGRIHKIR